MEPQGNTHQQHQPSINLQDEILPTHLAARVSLPFLLSIAIAAITLTGNLSHFPLYFFCDEAIHGVEARSLLTTGRDSTGTPWPLFFAGFGAFQLSLSVYAHTIIQSVLPLSEFTVRLVGVFAGLLFCIGITRITHFTSNDWGRSHWTPSSKSLLDALPTLCVISSSFFFLHFRTGYEFVISIAMWVLGITLFHLTFSRSSERYSTGTRLIFAVCTSLVFAIAFYTYTPARGWIPLTIVFLALCYFPRLLRSPWITTLGILSFFVLMAPYILVSATNPAIAVGRLQDMGIKTWGDLSSIPFNSILLRALEVLNPWYWLSWEGPPRFESSERHIIPGIPLLQRFLLPFVVIGAVRLLFSAPKSEICRTLLVLYPIGAFPAALIAVNPLRCSPIGALLLLYGIIGIIYSLKLVSHIYGVRRIAPATCITAIVSYIVYLQYYITDVAPRLYSDYGFYGLQVGEKEVFRQAISLIESGREVNLTHGAFNGNEKLIQFYLTPEQAQHLQVREAEKTCDGRAIQKDELWIVREELYQEVLIDKVRCPLISATPLGVVLDPRGRTLFRTLILQPRFGS